MVFLGAVAAKEGSVALQGYLSTSEAAKRLGVSSKTLLRWIKDGRFPGALQINPYAKNSAFLVPQSALEAFELRRQAGGGPDKE